MPRPALLNVLLLMFRSLNSVGSVLEMPIPHESSTKLELVKALFSMIAPCTPPVPAVYWFAMNQKNFGEVDTRQDASFRSTAAVAHEVVDIVRQGFLHIHRQAGAHRTEGLGSMHVVGRADAGGVEMASLLAQHFAPVLIQTRVGIFGFDALDAVGVDFGYANQLHFGVGRDAVEG